MTGHDPAAVFRADQRRRWREGEHPLVETYLERHSSLRDDPEAILDLILNEVILREESGEPARLDEYLGRFPKLEHALRLQFDLHQALQDVSEPASAGEAATSIADHLEPGMQPEEMPRSFGRYLILKTLGKGGMGTVYLAEDRLLGRTVALKVPRFHEPDHSGLVQRFYREARIAATFNHENLCRVYDVGHAEGRHYFTMPVLSGKPLSASLNREGPLPEREAARLTSLLAHAMQEAHRLGVIHRDLKPSNVMISENGSPIVMDFGLAHRAADQDPRLTPAGTFMGTPLYVAPEQIGGGPERPSVAGDVYSLGIMFYEMLTGRAPFQGDVNEVLRQVLTGVSDPPSRFRPSLDRRLDAICMSAIEKAPEARFRSMAEFAKALEDYLQADDAVTTHEDARIVRPSPKPSPPVTGATLPTSARRARRRRALAVGLFALVTLPILIVIAAQRYLGSNTDLLQPGTRWSGDVEFAQPFARISDYHIQIKSRHGKSFEALCEGENGEYQWVIAGTIEDGTIRWRFKKVLREAMWTGVVEGASVVGHYRDKAIVATFRDANSSATLKLTLVE